MALEPVAVRDPIIDPRPVAASVSWGAVWAGVATSLATALILALVAAGLGMRTAYLAAGSGGVPSGFTPVVGAWTIAGQCVAAALGGYVTGRLRHAWPGVHLDEAHFRDTAHGLVTWAVATLLAVALARAVTIPSAEPMGGAYAAMLNNVQGLTPAQTAHAADIAAQLCLFMAVGLLLSAFVAAVAARVGGERSEAMYLKV